MKLFKHPPSQPRPAGTVTQIAKDHNDRGLVMLRTYKKGEVGAPHKPGNNAIRLAVVMPALCSPLSHRNSSTRHCCNK